jgi:23S rRNA (cytosine1962-C5)-methyltransferase
MAKIKVKLTRSLRKSIQQGHPWVYREAIAPVDATPTASLARVSDAKGDLAWAIFDPHSPLALRILSTEAAPPSFANGFFPRRFERALRMRNGVRSDLTTAFRLFNGEGDLLPGLVCDVYGDVAVIQFDGQGPGEFWDKAEIATWLLANASVKTVIEKTRRSAERTIVHLAGETIQSVKTDEPATVVVKENGALFKVNLEKGQKTGFFLDQRDNRFYVRQSSQNKSVLNLFSYTGGFSISAGLGGASRVASVDISAGAIAGANDNWVLNGLKASQHQGLAVDVFDYLAKEGGDWDHVIVDPPSMSHSEDRKEIAIQKYTDLFATAAKRVKSGAELSLSSCSSHVSFEDFFKIISESMSQARRRGQILRVSGQGSDHPFPHAAPELRYLKFVHLVLD